MKRELGKVPTNINKDMVAQGAIKTHSQIVQEGSTENYKTRLAQRIEQEKRDTAIKAEMFKQQSTETKKNYQQQQSQSFVKRIEHERER